LEVFLFRIDKSHSIFYSEGPEITAESEMDVVGGATVGWAERKYRNLQKILTESQSGIGLRVRRVWEWLQRRTEADELLLRALRGAKHVRLNYPPSLRQHEAEEIWSKYLDARNRKHKLWLVSNGLVIPVTLLLAPIPGPNIIGYWFLYRAFCHVFALMGLRRARDKEIETVFQPVESLNGFWADVDDKRLNALEEEFGLSELDEFLRKSKATTVGERSVPLAAS
jgi:hypothetical protein